jgi:hypothetical protein
MGVVTFIPRRNEQGFCAVTDCERPPASTHKYRAHLGQYVNTPAVDVTFWLCGDHNNLMRDPAMRPGVYLFRHE